MKAEFTIVELKRSVKNPFYEKLNIAVLAFPLGIDTGINPVSALRTLPNAHAAAMNTASPFKRRHGQFLTELLLNRKYSRSEWKNRLRSIFPLMFFPCPCRVFLGKTSKDVSDKEVV